MTSPHAPDPMQPPPAYRLKRPAPATTAQKPGLAPALCPIIVSCPHTGTWVPPEMARLMNPTVLQTLPDTDWYVDGLYDFAPSIGADLLSATYSRYVIDLNRDPRDQPLYGDGRVESSLFPQDTFHNEPLFTIDRNTPPLRDLRKPFLTTVYQPYHQQIEHLIQEKKRTFSHVLLWEAHSITRHVPRIQKEPFADIIIGDGLGTTCTAAITDIIRSGLGGSYVTVMNQPFRGGYITRHYGKPDAGVFTIQIEMSQDLYLKPQAHGFPEISDQSIALKKALEQTMRAVSAHLVAHHLREDP